MDDELARAVRARPEISHDRKGPDTMKMLTLCFELAEDEIAQRIAARYATGFDSHGLRALLDVGTVVEARLLAIPRPGIAAPRFSSMLLCTTYEGPVDTYLEEFYR